LICTLVRTIFSKGIFVSVLFLAERDPSSHGGIGNKQYPSATTLGQTQKCQICTVEGPLTLDKFGCHAGPIFILFSIISSRSATFVSRVVSE